MRILLTLIFFFLAQNVFAYQEIVVPASPNELVIIESPEKLSYYFGELTGFPHTFQFEVFEPFIFRVQVFEPEVDNPQNKHSGIIIRERDDGRGVDEVARMRAKEATWKTFYDSRTMEKYQTGEKFEDEIGPGVYRFEVSTPENLGKYYVSLGTIEDKSGYFGKLSELYQVKKFLGKAPITIVASPLIYVPLVFLLLIFIGYRYNRKKYVS